MAENQYAAYCYEFGYPPSNPNHLIAFGKTNGVKVTWGEAKKLINEKPDTSGYQPPNTNNNENGNGNQSPIPQTDEEEKNEKMETTKRYSSNRLGVDDETELETNNKGSSSTKYKYLVTQLTNQGWDHDLALSALKASNGNLNLAIESLMSGGGIQSGPRSSWRFSEKGGVRDKINRFNTSEQTEAHALDGGKWIKKNRYSPNQLEPHALNGGKYIKKQPKRESMLVGKVKDQIRKAYKEYEAEKGKAPSDVQSFVTYCKKKNVKKANWSYCQEIMEEMQQNQTNDQQQFESEPRSVQHNNHGQNPQPQESKTNDVMKAFETLLDNHASIKQRLRCMDTISVKLNELDILADNGRVLLTIYAEQIGHEDYIHNEYAVRIKAIEKMSDIFVHVLNEVPYQQIPDLIDQSLPEIFDALYKLLDDPKQQRFHDIAKLCIVNIIDAIIAKKNQVATINLCGILNEKINSENISQADSRFFTAQLIFQKLIFGGHSAVINNLFSIDINSFSNNLEQWSNGININNQIDLPQDRLWLDLLIANNWSSNDDETFKDIIADCLGIMILDTNQNIGVIGSNLIVYLQHFNDNFKNSLEDEAKHRFNNYYKPQQIQSVPNPGSDYQPQGNNGVMNKINKWNTNGPSEPHTLDGGKYIKMNRNSPNTQQPQYDNYGRPISHNDLLDFPNNEPKKRNSMMVEKILSQIRKAYKDYETEKSKPPSDVQQFMTYCKRKNINKANWSHCQEIMKEMQQNQANNQSQNESGSVQYNNNGNNQIQNQWQGASYNNSGQNQQFQNQSGNVPQNNYGQNQQSQPPKKENTYTVHDAIELLLGGHGSVKQRLRAMDTINANMNEIDINSDNGKVLLSIYAEQIAHEDYIWREYAVRTKAIQQIADIFVHCLNKVPYQKIPDLVEQSFAELLDILYKIANDNRERKFHNMAKLCTETMISAVFAKKHKLATINLCGILNEKINSENITQVAPRFFTAQQIFQHLIFGGQSAVINNLFNIDINGYNNNIEKWRNGVTINTETDLPPDRLWFDLLIANNWNNNDDETFKDIISDCLSVMILDPNQDIGFIAKNLTVFLQEFNDNFKNCLETEAKHRFGKYYISQQKQSQTQNATNAYQPKHDTSTKALRSALKEIHKNDDKKSNDKLSYDIDCNKSKKLNEIIENKMDNNHQHNLVHNRDIQRYHKKPLPIIQKNSDNNAGPDKKRMCPMCTFQNLTNVNLMGYCKICDTPKGGNHTNNDNHNKRDCDGDGDIVLSLEPDDIPFIQDIDKNRQKQALEDELLARKLMMEESTAIHRQQSDELIAARLQMEHEREMLKLEKQRLENEKTALALAVKEELKNAKYLQRKKEEEFAMKLQKAEEMNEQKINDLFQASLQNTRQIVSIHDISGNNKNEIYEKILSEKLKNGKTRDQIERYLWHGTKNLNNLQLIMKNGFDRSYNTASRYGKGTYFARDAAYSAGGYCGCDNNGIYYILLCKVIVGAYTIGNSQVTAIPKKPDGSEYDSLVNNMYDPSIFVIWRDYHSCPAYLIKFK